MPVYETFLRSDGQLRAGWRFLIFVISYILVSFLLGWLWPPPENFVTGMFRVMCGRIAVTLFISWIMLRVLEHKPVSRVGIGLASGWTGVLGFGVLMGIVLVAATSAALVVAGGVHFERLSNSSAAASAFAEIPALELLAWTPFIFLAAASEELLIRGYPFRVLVEGAGAAIAVAATSVVFGLLHAMNPDASVVSVVNTILAGVMLSLACLRARSLWYAIGLHFSWNWTLAAYGFPVSGLEMPSLGWKAISSAETTWLHGGAYGPEAGAVVTVVLTLACVVIWFQPRAAGLRELGSGAEHQVGSSETPRADSPTS